MFLREHSGNCADDLVPVLELGLIVVCVRDADDHVFVEFDAIIRAVLAQCPGEVADEIAAYGLHDLQSSPCSRRTLQGS